MVDAQAPSDEEGHSTTKCFEELSKDQRVHE
jgi:hypothetical protein